MNTAVWRALISGPLLAAPGRSLLAVAAIAIGVALGLAVHLINASAASEFERAARHDGPYVRLMQKVGAQAEKVYGKSLPVNATGAIGAIASELQLPWKIVRGIGVLARAIGLVGHILEEMKNPMAYEIKQRAEEEATAHLRQP